MAKHQLPLHIRVLEAELEKRKSRNSRYSMRAFARYLEMDPSALSRVLSGKLDLSLQTCGLILKKIELSPTEARLFIASVSEDKRNRSAAILTRALDPELIDDTDFDPRYESIVRPDEKLGLGGQDVLALSRDIISMMDLGGRFLHANTTAAKRLKRIPCELVGDRWADTVVGPEAAELFEQQQALVIETNREQMFEFTLKDGDQVRYYTRLITPVYRNDGSMLAYASTIRDVTAEKLLWAANDQMFAAGSLQELLRVITRSGGQALSSSCVLQLGKDFENANFISAHHRIENSDDGYLNFVNVSPLGSALESTSPQSSKSTLLTLNTNISRELSYKKAPSPQNVLVTPLLGPEGAKGRLVFLRENEFPTAAPMFAERLARSASTALQHSQTAGF